MHKASLNCLLSQDLKQLVTTPTHQLGNTLDLILTNKSGFVSDFNVIDPGLSDHFMVEIGLITSLTCQGDQNKKYFKLCNKAYVPAISEILNDTLLKVKWAVDNGIMLVLFGRFLKRISRLQ